MKHISLFFFCLCLLEFCNLNSYSQPFTKDQNEKIIQQARFVIEEYRDYMNLLGNINEPLTDREQAYKPTFIRLFFGTNTTVFNDLDPDLKTSGEYTPKQYADNILLWYKNGGIKVEIDQDQLSFGSIRRHEGDYFYMDVGVSKKVFGRYIQGSLNNQTWPLVIRIVFQNQKGIVKNFSIAGINRAGTEPPVVVTEPVKPPSDNQRYSFEPEMVFVQGGTFQMGSNDGYNDEKPVHSVTVTDFYLGRYEVTQKQWQKVMGNNPSYFKNCDTCPVESVSWSDVQVFLQRLNQKTGKSYRLPTEAEWEYAAKGGSKSEGFKYSGSNIIGDVAWYNDNAGNQSHRVGKLGANEVKLFDMSGNVSEWCSDFYLKIYYGSSPTDNPKGPVSGSLRVTRGGNWYGGAWNCRSSNRGVSSPGNRNNALGFRIALSK